MKTIESTLSRLPLTCPICGFDIDIWSDESETECKLCGYTPFNHEKVMN